MQSRRITVRLTQDDFRILQELGQRSGLDVSNVVRSALRSTKMPDEGCQLPKGTAKPFPVPDRILVRARKYFAWGNGDLKDEWARLFDECFALTLTCKQLYPKTTRFAETLAHLADIEHRFPRNVDSV